MSVVEVRDVSVRYGRATVVDSVSLSIDRGQWLGLLGPNGAGKSSLLRVIVGERPASGAALVENVALADVARKERASSVAYVPQTPIFPQGMSVFDYVLLGRTPYMGILAAESSADVAEVWSALEALDLTDFAARDVSSLSGGETQRAALARVLAQDAPVLVLDEATASLDVAHQHRVLTLIDGLRRTRGLTVIAAMHDLTAAAQFCDTVAMLEDGRLRGFGTPRDVLTEELLSDVFDPGVRVIDVEGTPVIVAVRQGARR